MEPDHPRDDRGTSNQSDVPAILVGPKTDTSIVNLNTHDCDIVIDRTSKWGNPFRLGDPTQLDPETNRPYQRQGSIKAFRKWVKTQPEFLESLKELVGKRLGCHCKPKDCHGDVILELIEERFIL